MLHQTAHVTDVDGQRVGWVEARADGAPTPDLPPVVLIHGLATSGAWWAPSVPALAAGRRVLLVDLLGFGSSHGQPFRLDTAADVLAGWMAAIGVDRADVVGHSMGGFVGADLAARRPDLVRRLVLVDAAGLPLHHRVTQHLLNVVNGGVRAPLPMYPVAIACALRCGPLTIARAAHQVLATDLSDRLGRIAAPTLVVWGARDQLLTAEFGRRLADAIPGARFEVIEGAGHSPMWEQPAEFERLVVGFLDAPVDDSAAESGSAGSDSTESGDSVLAPTGGRLVGRYLAVGDWSIHVRVGRPSGPVESPPIVFVHGFVISSRYHVPTMRLLARRHLVLGLDLPGFGWSSKPDTVLDVPGLANALIASLDAAGIGRAVFVGNSLGSQIVAQAAADHPDRVLGTVLTSPTFDPTEPSLARHVLRLVVSIPHEHPSLLLEHVPDYIQAGLPRAIGTLRYAWAHRIEQVLPEVHAPTVIVRGEHDSVVPRRWAREAATLVPGGRALEISGAGHAVNHGAPVSLARIVEEVVRSVGEAGAGDGAQASDGTP